MIVEVVFNEQSTPSPQRRPNGHMKTGATKKGNKRRGFRGRRVTLLDEEEVSEEETDENDWFPAAIDLLFLLFPSPLVR